MIEALRKARAALATCNSNDGDDPWYDATKVREAIAAIDAALAQADAPADERAEFEKWIAKDGGDLGTFGNGRNVHYRNSAVNNAWLGWQARAASAPAAPKEPQP